LIILENAMTNRIDLLKILVIAVLLAVLFYFLAHKGALFPQT